MHTLAHRYESPVEEPAESGTHRVAEKTVPDGNHSDAPTDGARLALFEAIILLARAAGRVGAL